MKHGYRPRTSVGKPDWYRRWESSQRADTCYVLNGKTLVCSPAMFEKLQSELTTRVSDGSLPVTFNGLQVIADPHMPPPQWQNRAARLREKRRKDRERVRRALENNDWERRLHRVAGFVSPVFQHPFTPLS